MLSARRGLQFGQEGCGPWSRACLVVSGLFWPLEAGTHATNVGSEGQYYVSPICSKLFQCAVLIFNFGAKCELGGCALLPWLHTLPAYCHQFDDTICICATFSPINLLPTNVRIVPWTWFTRGVSDYFKIVSKYEPMRPTCGWFQQLAASVHMRNMSSVCMQSFINWWILIWLRGQNHQGHHKSATQKLHVMTT